MVQIFGVKGSQATRAAERFFKERRVEIQSFDLQKKPMSPGEIKRFVDRFGLPQLVDRDHASIKYLRLSDSEMFAKIEREPKILRLPLVRSGNRLSVGQDEAGWKLMLS